MTRCDVAEVNKYNNLENLCMEWGGRGHVPNGNCWKGVSLENVETSVKHFSFLKIFLFVGELLREYVIKKKIIRRIEILYKIIK